MRNSCRRAAERLAVEQAEFERARQLFQDEVRTRVGGTMIDTVELFQYGDVPEIEPGELLGKIYIAVPEGRDPDDRTARREAFSEFNNLHREQIAELRKVFAATSFGGGLNDVDFPNTSPATPRGPVLHMKVKAERVEALLHGGGDQPVTAVMARLGREDLETLDTLIGAGIAGSRAEAVRWVLARIRERPAYEQLRARSREIEALKSQF
jgi:hypothetical protein